MLAFSSLSSSMSLDVEPSFKFSIKVKSLCSFYDTAIKPLRLFLHKRILLTVLMDSCH